MGPRMHMVRISVSFFDTIPMSWEEVRYSNCFRSLMRLRIPSSQVATRKQADHPGPSFTPSSLPHHSTHNPFPKVDPRSSLPFFFSFDRITFSKQGFFYYKLQIHLGVNDNPPYSSFRPPHVRKTKGECGRSGMSFFPLSFPCHFSNIQSKRTHSFFPGGQDMSPPDWLPDSACGLAVGLSVTSDSCDWGLHTRDLRT